MFLCKGREWKEDCAKRKNVEMKEEEPKIRRGDGQQSETVKNRPSPHFDEERGNQLLCHPPREHKPQS